METQQHSSSFRPTNHIFLSFRGADIRRNFIGHLYTALCNAGFHTFRDEDLLKGEEIGAQIKRAIKESSISIIVFSKHYASSRWCLEELVQILQRHNSVDGFRVFPIFYDVEPTELGNQKGSFKEAFDEYEESGVDSKEKIDEWRKALEKVAKIAGKVLQAESNG